VGPPWTSKSLSRYIHRTRSFILGLFGCRWASGLHKTLACAPFGGHVSHRRPIPMECLHACSCLTLAHRLCGDPAGYCLRGTETGICTVLGNTHPSHLLVASTVSGNYLLSLNAQQCLILRKGRFCDPGIAGVRSCAKVLDWAVTEAVGRFWADRF
jgi:hypothetical protein